MREGTRSSKHHIGHMCLLSMACGDKGRRGVETCPTKAWQGCWVGWS